VNAFVVFKKEMDDSNNHQQWLRLLWYNFIDK